MSDIEPTGARYFVVDGDNEVANQANTKKSKRELGAELKEDVFTQSLEVLACWSIGPLEICAKYRKVGIDYEVKLLSQRIGHGRLDPSKATVKIGVDVGLAKIGLSLKADFAAKTLRAKGEVCVRDFFGDWQCDGFNEVILRW